MGFGSVRALFKGLREKDVKMGMNAQMDTLNFVKNLT